MQLDFLVPGLLSAPASIQMSVHAPSLTKLMARGAAVREASTSAEDWLARHVCDANDSNMFPFAAIARIGEIDDQTNGGHWLRADPVHFSINRDRVVLLDSSQLAITLAESDALIASFNSHFSRDHLKFFAPHSQRWYVQSEQPIALITFPPTVVRGRNVADYGFDGAGAKIWQTRQSEMQMLLHAHAVNDEREAAGQLAINSVWLWGAGELPMRPAARYDCLAGDDALIAGLAAWMKVGHASNNSFKDIESFKENTLVVLNALTAPAAYGDWETWRSELQSLERNWFSPAMASLKSGKLDCARIVDPHPSHGKQFTTTRADLLKFWRRLQAA